MATSDKEQVAEPSRETDEGGREGRLAGDLYLELYALAVRKMKGERPSPTFTPSDLLIEAYNRIAKSSRSYAKDRGSLFALASRAMRQVLVDRAKEQRAAKRIPRERRVQLDELKLELDGSQEEILFCDEILKLVGQQVSPRAERALEARLFMGFRDAQIASILGIDVRTVQRDFESVRDWYERRFGARR